MDLVSIIVPVYNVEEYLPKCLDSIVSQTYKDIEIILVDDGSSDNSGSICDEYASSDSRIKVIHKVNGGVSSARNCGIRISKGKYVCFIDSDDTVENTYVEVLVSSYLGEDVELVLCNIKDIYHNKFYNKREIIKNLSGIFFDDYHKLVNLLRVPVIKLYRADIIKSNNLYFKEKVNSAEDQIFNFQYYRFVKKYLYNDSALYNYYHRTNNSLSQKCTLKAYENNLEKLSIEKEFLEQNKIFMAKNILTEHAITCIVEFGIIEDNNNYYSQFLNRVHNVLVYIDFACEVKSVKRKIALWLLKNELYFFIYAYCMVKYYKKFLLTS